MTEETKKTDQELIDDMKDYLLFTLQVPQLEDFKKEIESEILMRKCTVERRNKYVLEVEKIKRDHRTQLEKLKRDFEATKIKKKLTQDSDIDEESEEIEIPKTKARGKKKN